MSSTLRQRYPDQQAFPSTEANYKDATARDSLLLDWDDLPAWAKDNEYIHTGFRPLTGSYLDCFMGCFYVHNETANIYSHLLATLWMIALPIMCYGEQRSITPRPTSTINY